jgi:uncharacterized membrane protein YczE
MATTDNRPPRLSVRLGQLYVGLVLYGVSMAVMVESTLGLTPWDVLHQGLARQTGLSIGTAAIIVGVAVLLLWLPLRQRPGLGTISNVVVIGLVVDLTLALIPTVTSLPVRIALLVTGIVLNALATVLYLNASFGPGPRDGLMTGLVARRPGWSIRIVRSVIELTVLATGWLLGGQVGLGTVAYALAVGPLIQLFMRLLGTARPAAPSPTTRTKRTWLTRRKPLRDDPAVS